MMIPLPQKPKYIPIEKNRGKIEIEALYPGYGTTLGNSLRRVLLSSLEGAAITQMKIKGVPHEFSTIPGIVEDVVTIMLNLKQVRFKMIGNNPQKAFLKVKGEKVVKAKDFEVPPQLEIVNKDLVICNLTSPNAKLEMEVLVEKGVGYLPREEMDKSKAEINTIFVDAIFSPVKKVGMKVENMRVGKRTDYERLFLDIETDGTISPLEAFKEAIRILVEQFNFLQREVYEEKEKGAKTS